MSGPEKNECDHETRIANTNYRIAAAHFAKANSTVRAQAAEITRLRAEVTTLREAAKAFEDHYERGICHHESTHRGGSIWTICDDCGAEWADDRGGFKAFEYPPDIVRARAARMPAEGRAALEQDAQS